MKIGWELPEISAKNGKKSWQKCPEISWKRIVDSGLWPLWLSWHFSHFSFWRLLTAASDVKSHQTVQIGCFTSPSIRGISEKQSFLVYFSARYHILKKKQKKKRYWAYVAVVLKITLSILVTCLVSSNCSVTHVRWGEGTSSVLFQWRPHFKRSGDVETVLFQCITLITFGIPDQTSPNFQGCRRNGCEWCVQNYM